MKIQLFGGKGFVGSVFANKAFFTSEVFCKVNEREDYTVADDVDEIVYMISTVTNYNVKTNPYIDIDGSVGTM